jgi:hypothetical protein
LICLPAAATAVHLFIQSKKASTWRLLLQPCFIGGEYQLGACSADPNFLCCLPVCLPAAAAAIEQEGINLVPAGSRLLVLDPVGLDESGREVALGAIRKNVLGFTQVGAASVLCLWVD